MGRRRYNGETKCKHKWDVQECVKYLVNINTES
jgi:hypothetical protein